MYAVIELGSKQYKVSPGDVFGVAKIDGNKKGSLVISEVLLVYKDRQLHIGQPYVKGARVKAHILDSYKGKKTIAYRYLRRKDSRLKKGHRTSLTRIEIEEISLK